MLDLDKAYAGVNTRASNRRSGFEFDGKDCEIIFKHDIAGNLTFLNEAGELISGYSRQEACGMNIAQFVAPEFAERVHDCVAGNSSKRLGTVYEIDIIAKNGRRIALEVSTETIERDGRPVEIQGIAAPATVRRESRSHLRRCLDADFFFGS